MTDAAALVAVVVFSLSWAALAACRRSRAKAPPFVAVWIGALAVCLPSMPEAAFANGAPSPSLNITVSGGGVLAGKTAIDHFTLVDTSGAPGTIDVPEAPAIASPGGPIAPAGYTIGDAAAVYTELSALRTALAARPPLGAGASLTIGVRYTVPRAAIGEPISDRLAAKLTVAERSAVRSAVAENAVVPARALQRVNAPTGAAAGAAFRPSRDSTGPAAPARHILSGATPITGTCYVATSQSTHPLCWLDFSAYPGIGTSAFTFNLPDGSKLTGTVDNSGLGAQPFAMTNVPTWNKAALGNTSGAYVGVAGEPAFYWPAQWTDNTISFTNLAFTDPNGASVAFGLIMADAESTNAGESYTWTTNGGAWTLVDQPRRRISVPSRAWARKPPRAAA
jgi:hypothetical protein